MSRAVRWPALALLAGAVLVGLAACGGGGGDNGSGAVPAGALVVPGLWTVIGSSTPAGVGATANRGWVDLLRGAYAARGVSVTNLAVGGSVSYQGLPAQTPIPSGRPAPDPVHNIDAALAGGPRLVIASYPSNDTAAGFTADETVANLQRIRDAAGARGVPVLVTGTQPSRAAPSAQQAATAAAIDAALARNLGACFVDLRPALSGPGGTLDPRLDSGDGQHLNDAGHAVVAERVQGALEAGGCVRVR